MWSYGVWSCVVEKLSLFAQFLPLASQQRFITSIFYCCIILQTSPVAINSTVIHLTLIIIDRIPDPNAHAVYPRSLNLNESPCRSFIVANLSVMTKFFGNFCNFAVASHQKNNHLNLSNSNSAYINIFFTESIYCTCTVQHVKTSTNWSFRPKNANRFIERPSDLQFPCRL